MSTSAPLQGQVAIVTGGASGIGRAVGELFAGAGLAGLAVIDVAECDLSDLDAEVVTGQFDVADATRGVVSFRRCTIGSAGLTFWSITRGSPRWFRGRR